MQDIIQDIHGTHKTSPLVTMRFCILPESEELYNDICEFITSNGIDARQFVVLVRENLNLNNDGIKSLIDTAIISSKNMICIYYPPSPPASKWFDAIITLRYENETETRVKAFFLKHFRDDIVGEKKFIDPQECLEAIGLEEKSTRSSFNINGLVRETDNAGYKEEKNLAALF